MTWLVALLVLIVLIESNTRTCYGFVQLKYPKRSWYSKNHKKYNQVASNNFVSTTTSKDNHTDFKNNVAATTFVNDSIEASDNHNEEKYQREQEMERNLRFAGIGRLYTTPTTRTSDKVVVASLITSTTTETRTKSSSSKGLKLKDDVEPYIGIIDKLTTATVIVIGLGGVGSWAAEALCRSGIGNLILIDLDDICISNTNRQAHALTSTIGKMKIDEMKLRLQDINPQCNITLIHDFISTENIDSILTNYIIPSTTNNNKSNSNSNSNPMDNSTIITNSNSTVVCLDAIDGSKAKTALLAACTDCRIPIVTCGGTAGRQDPTKFSCDDITRVTGDRLLSTCRKNLRKYYNFSQGISYHESKKKKKQQSSSRWRINAIFSTEPSKSVPVGNDNNGSTGTLRRCDGALGTACFVTGTAGFLAAGKVVDMIVKDNLKPPTRGRR